MPFFFFFLPEMIGKGMLFISVLLKVGRKLKCVFLVCLMKECRFPHNTLLLKSNSSQPDNVFLPSLFSDSLSICCSYLSLRHLTVFLPAFSTPLPQTSLNVSAFHTNTPGSCMVLLWGSPSLMAELQWVPYSKEAKAWSGWLQHKCRVSAEGGREL